MKNSSRQFIFLPKCQKNEGPVSCCEEHVSHHFCYEQSTKNQALLFTMILATLQQIVYSLQEKLQGGGVGGYTECLKQLPCERRFLS